MVGWYVKRPIPVEAVRWSGENLDEMSRFLGGHSVTALSVMTGFEIRTLEGDMRVSVGDWIIRGVRGEFYPCKPDIFAQTYEPVE